MTQIQACTPFFSTNSTSENLNNNREFQEIRAKQQGQYSYPKGFKSDYVESNGIRLHYVSGGKGPPLIFVHGFASTWKMWEPAMKYFASAYQVIAIDMPGLGQSESSKIGSSTRDTSSYLLTAFKKLTNNQPIILVAHDMGVLQTYAMIAQNPHYVKKVIFLDSVPPDSSIWSMPGYTAQGPGPTWHFGYFSFEDGEIAAKMVATHPKLFLSAFIKSWAGKKEVFTHHLLGELIEPYSKIENLRSAFEQYVSISKSIKQTATFPKLDIPIMTIGAGKGVGDELAKLMAKKYVKDPQQLKSVLLPKCGHWLMEECPTEVISHIDGFLKN
jgi:pimeloyl-ACP methyl ester carboxylesterase